MKLGVYWLLVVAALSGISYLYQPTTELAVISAILLLLLSVIVSWSAHKLANGSKALFKTLVVAVVAGFMYSQAMDIAYSGFFAPAGLRLDLLPEALAAALLLTIFGSLSRLAFLRPKQKKQSDSENSERSPE